MHNFINIKKGLTLLAVLAVSYSLSAQQRDTITSVTDTTSAGISQRVLAGEKIKGIVTDGNTNRPMPGVNVSIGTFSATITDNKGNFTITVPDYKATIQVKAENYHTRLVPVFKGKAIAVKLYPASFSSVYATANLPLGEQSLARTVAAVSTQSAVNPWPANSETAGSLMQGQIPGANVIRRSGTPAIGADMFLRGFTSLYGTNKPLYVVDGMIYDTESYGSSIISGHVNNPLQHIDLRDIESYTVIKDAPGAAIYGTRSANGVIVINTARARELSTKIDFSSYGGINLKPKTLPLMGVADYRTYLSDILLSRGATSAQVALLPYMNDDPATNPDYYPYHNNTDWQKTVFKGSYDQNYYMKVSGGDNIAKYVLSVGYLNDRGIIDTTSYKRYNTRFNADLNLSQKMAGAVNVAFSYGEQNLKDQGISATTNPIFSSLIKAPFLNTNAVSTDGSVSPTLADADIFGNSNPRSLIEDGNNLKKTYRFFGSTNFDYKFGKSIKLSTILGTTYDKIQQSLFIPRIGVANDTLSNVIGDSRLGSQVIRYFAMYNDTRLSFNKVLDGIHKINAVAGFRYTSNHSEEDIGQGYNSGTDELKSVGNSDASNNRRFLGGGIGKWKSLNTFVTADYSLADKFLFNASVAMDGSSRFGSDVKGALTIGGTKFALLPAAGAAWIVSSEDFMKNAKAVDLLKLRVSYGLTGNDDIGNYTAQQYYVSQNLLGIQGLVRGNIANPYLQWEVVKKFNAGTDASFFNERLSLSFDYWSNTTDKMLTSQPLVSLAGISSYISNDAAMRTKGFDLGLNARLLNSSTVKWDAGLSLGKYSNEVTKLESGTFYNEYAGGTYITKVGSAANSFFGYRTDGVYATDAEATAAGLSIRLSSGELVPFKAGDMKFMNLNSSDKVIDENDRTIIGDPNPGIFGSVSNRLSYKKLTFDALVTFVSGNEVYNYTRSQLESGMNFYNQTVALNNRWRGQGQVTSIPRAANGDPMGNSRFSDRWIEDGSYIRLRTVSLTYELPVKGALKYVNIYATANNLITFSKYLGYDPEFSASGSIFNQGVDTTLEPQFKSFQLGFRLGL